MNSGAPWLPGGHLRFYGVHRHPNGTLDVGPVLTIDPVHVTFHTPTRAVPVIRVSAMPPLTTTP